MIQHLEDKILDNTQLTKKLAIWKFQNKKIVFTNGCFDLLHMGHLNYLAKARALGDLLILGLNTDKSVQKLKGANRPIKKEIERATQLAALLFVDAVVLFGEDTPLELIKLIQPNVLVKGADYEVNQIVGADVVIAGGGEVKTIEFLEGYSSTKLINKITDSNLK